MMAGDLNTSIRHYRFPFFSYPFWFLCCAVGGGLPVVLRKFRWYERRVTVVARCCDVLLCGGGVRGVRCRGDGTVDVLLLVFSPAVEPHPCFDAHVAVVLERIFCPPWFYRK